MKTHRVPKNLPRLAIIAAFLASACAGTAFAFGSKPSTQGQSSSSDTLWVVRPDGSRNCVKDSGQRIEDVAAELTKAGVTVLESKKTGDGKMHPMVCGAATGRQNAYRIHSSDQAGATQLGFQVATHANAPGLFIHRQGQAQAPTG